MCQIYNDLLSESGGGTDNISDNSLCRLPSIYLHLAPHYCRKICIYVLVFNLIN